jgi:hypothetical protein
MQTQPSTDRCSIMRLCAFISNLTSALLVLWFCNLHYIAQLSLSHWSRARHLIFFLCISKCTYMAASASSAITSSHPHIYPFSFRHARVLVYTLDIWDIPLGVEMSPRRVHDGSNLSCVRFGFWDIAYPVEKKIGNEGIFFARNICRFHVLYL